MSISLLILKSLYRTRTLIIVYRFLGDRIEREEREVQVFLIFNIGISYKFKIYKLKRYINIYTTTTTNTPY